MFKIMFIESDEWNQANMDDSRAELGFTEAANRLIRNPGYKSRKFVSRASVPLKPILAIIYSQCSEGSSGLGPLLAEFRQFRRRILWRADMYLPPEIFSFASKLEHSQSRTTQMSCRISPPCAAGWMDSSFSWTRTKI
jgi:hypothetical protein